MKKNSVVAPIRRSLTLNLEATSSPKQRLGLSLNLGGTSFISALGDSVDVQLPLECQGFAQNFLLPKNNRVIACHHLQQWLRSVVQPWQKLAH
ncbi:hypothetical protein L798_01484 [Zootermopsis nevadensis]|uniref:Uncharacterized protein n=1 Tax=Zootermopsis nevadensis TaxID=136037 RepID=A0A067QJ80_ZOONE|nr:hypothetical protein L798_01484 [Zootermopsis nevadensis]